MPRSATDATRFTSTTPHASSKPTTSTSDAGQTAPRPSRTLGAAGETQLERVKRLRAAANRARDAQLTFMDKAIVRGRVWADRAHRITALALITFSGVMGVVTVYALGDMIIHNRRKREEFFTELKAKEAAALSKSLYEAEIAVRLGTATEEQHALLDNQQRAREEKRLAAEEHKIEKSPGIFAQVSNLMFSGLKTGKESTEAERLDSAKQEPTGQLLEVDRDTPSRDIFETSDITQDNIASKAKAAFEKERLQERRGGMLDRLGSREEGAETRGSTMESQTTSGHSKSGRSWTSFMTGR